jgi:hypothetical protein
LEQDADIDKDGLIDKYDLGKLITKMAPLEHPIDDLDAIFGMSGHRRQTHAVDGTKCQE